MGFTCMDMAFVNLKPCSKHFRVILPFILHPFLTFFFQKCQPVTKGEILPVRFLQAPLQMIVKTFHCFTYNGPCSWNLTGNFIRHIQCDLALLL